MVYTLLLSRHPHSLLHRDSLFDPWQPEEITSSELLCANRGSLTGATAQDALHVLGLRLQPCLNELGWVGCKAL